MTPLSRLEEVWRWRQAAVWAPIAWAPVVLYALLVGRTELAGAVGLAALLFAACARAVVGLARCGGCGVRWGAGGALFRGVWDDARCKGCGASLFELRRQERRDRPDLVSIPSSSLPSSARSPDGSPDRSPGRSRSRWG